MKREQSRVRIDRVRGPSIFDVVYFRDEPAEYRLSMVDHDDRSAVLCAQFVRAVGSPEPHRAGQLVSWDDLRYPNPLWRCDAAGNIERYDLRDGEGIPEEPSWRSTLQ